MRIAARLASALLGGACLHGTPSSELASLSSRRTALTAAAGLTAAVALPAAPALADAVGSIASGMDDEWTLHEGAFDEAFFKDFTVSKSAPDFKYKFLRDGDGGAKPVPKQKVFVNYRGYLLDGTLVDSSYGRGQDGKGFGFRLGKGKVILGWEGVVPGMTVGQRVVVRIPANMAYGDEKKGKIPPNSDLLFYMELMELGNIKD